MSVTTFRYSPAEIGALAAEIKLPGDIDKLHALANAEHVQGNRDLHEKLRSEMPRRVTLVLELCANGVLDGEHFVRRPRSRENLEIIDRIEKQTLPSYEMLVHQR